MPRRVSNHILSHDGDLPSGTTMTIYLKREREREKVENEERENKKDRERTVLGIIKHYFKANGE